MTHRRKSKEEEGRDSNEEEDPENCPVADLAALEETTDLIRQSYSAAHITPPLSGPSPPLTSLYWL